MVMLIARSEKERAGMQEQMRSDMEVEREQLQNMRAAGLKQAQREREAFIQENHALEERLLKMQKEDEENMKMIKSMSEMFAKHEREKLQLCTQMTELSQEEAEEALRELNNRHSEEVNKFLEKMDINLGGIKSSSEEALYSTEKGGEFAKKLEELPQIMTSREQMVAQVAPLVGKVAALYTPAAPYAEPVSLAVTGVAQSLLACDCSIL